MSTVEAPGRGQTQARGQRRRRLADAFRTEPSARTAVLCVVGLAVLSSAIRVALVSHVHAPTVFSDELGYEKLAQSIGWTGHLALFNHRGLSYSPLYPLVISPVYALGASAATAYSLIKIVDAVLISLAIFPTYGIARVVLPRRLSLIVAGVSVLAPLMTYPAFTLSENLAYPVCLCAIWAMLAAIRSPGPRADLVLVATVFLAAAARIQLIVLLPAALTAIVIAALLGRDSVGRRFSRATREHAALLVLCFVGVLIAAAASLTGHRTLSAFGRYAEVVKSGLPDLSHVLNLFVRHLAGLDLAVGVVPFAGSLVAAYAFLRSRRLLREQVAFASVAFAVTVWLLAEVAYDAALYDHPHADVPRIHERFLIYVVPFFLVGLFAAFRSAAAESRRIYLLAAAVAALLPAVIPFHTVVNGTIHVDSLGLVPFSRVVGGRVMAVPHATVIAIWVAALLALLYVQVRQLLRSIVILVLLPFVFISGLGGSRIESGSNFGRSLLPAHTDWVDRAHPAGAVVLISARNATAELETAYGNFSIRRLYDLCGYRFGAEFGERHVTIARSGRLRTASGYLTAQYVVAPLAVGIDGRVVARNPKGREVLVAPADGRVKVASGERAASVCKRPQKRRT